MLATIGRTANAQLAKRPIPADFDHAQTRALLRIGSVNVLLVEDHEDSRRVLSNLLTHCGHGVAAAANIAEALRLLDDGQFEVLICDIGLPDGSGLELVTEAKRRQPWKKTVALTAHGQAKDREQGLRAGFDEYLTKPFDFHQVRSLLADPA
ncbi:MAG: response regulator [Spartobacteria bacterium]